MTNQITPGWYTNYPSVGIVAFRLSNGKMGFQKEKLNGKITPFEIPMRRKMTAEEIAAHGKRVEMISVRQYVANV